MRSARGEAAGAAIQRIHLPDGLRRIFNNRAVEAIAHRRGGVNGSIPTAIPAQALIVRWSCLPDSVSNTFQDCGCRRITLLARC